MLVCSFILTDESDMNLSCICGFIFNQDAEDHPCCRNELRNLLNGMWNLWAFAVENGGVKLDEWVLQHMNSKVPQCQAALHSLYASLCLIILLPLGLWRAKFFVAGSSTVIVTTVSLTFPMGIGCISGGLSKSSKWMPKDVWSNLNLIESIQKVSMVPQYWNPSMCADYVDYVTVWMILVYYPGDMLPADGFVIYSNDLRVDESALTGETDLVRKGENNELCLFSGSYLVYYPCN